MENKSVSQVSVISGWKTVIPALVGCVITAIIILANDCACRGNAAFNHYMADNWELAIVGALTGGGAGAALRGIFKFVSLQRQGAATTEASKSE